MNCKILIYRSLWDESIWNDPLFIWDDFFTVENVVFKARLRQTVFNKKLTISFDKNRQTTFYTKRKSKGVC